MGFLFPIIPSRYLFTSKLLSVTVICPQTVITIDNGIHQVETPQHGVGDELS